MRAVHVILIILSLFAVSAFSQERKAKLLYAFERRTCSELRARLDNFLTEIVKDQEIHGFVVFSGEVNFFTAIRMRAPIEGQLDDRAFDPTRFHFVRKKGMAKFRTELWLATKLSDLPFEAEPEWDYRVARD